MEWLDRSIEKIDRQGSFLFQVKILYFSLQNRYITKTIYSTTPANTLEISIRMAPENDICQEADMKIIKLSHKIVVLVVCMALTIFAL